MSFNVKQLYLRIINNRNILDKFTVKLTTKCKYTRWAHRKPVAIVNENELFDDQDGNDTKKLSEKRRQRVRARNMKSQENLSRNQESLPNKKNNETCINGLSNRIINLKENDNIITSLMVNVKSRKMREKNNKILLEGHRLIKDGIEAGVKPEVILFSRPSDIMDLTLHEEVTLYKVPYRTMQLWSNLTTSPGILGIFTTPNIEGIEPSPDALPLTIVCDNIRDPGNLGSIIRIAAGVGCEKIIVLKGCVDLWDSKVLRSAAGAHFRVPIRMLTSNDLSSFVSDGTNVFVTDNDATNNSNNAFDVFDSKTRYSISKIYENFELPNVEFPKYDENLNNSKMKNIVRTLKSQLPVIPYYAVDYCTNEIILVINGETEGLSLETLKLLWEKRAVRVNVPLSNNVESLNVGSALGIISFEIQRQIIFKQRELYVNSIDVK